MVEENTGDDAKKVIYPELSYKIMGCLFEVSGEIGFGYNEKHYYNAIKVCFDKAGIKYKDQNYTNIKFSGTIVGKFFVDFLIEDKVILEIKVGNYFGKQNIEQTYKYLKANNLQLGILANFTRNGVKYRRILNLY